MALSEELVEHEVAQEQAFVDRVYVQLASSARAAQQLAREGHERGRLGHEGGLVERDAMVFQAAKRIAQLDAAHEGLVFGRLDLRPELDAEPRYVGRIGLRDENRDSLLIDWRAPAAAVFYQATAAEPHSVVRRRVLRCLGATVTGVEDELLDPDSPGAESLPIVGEGALMAQLSRARDRSMHSIVATIQAEQDKAIRAPGKGVVAISGGPGTGKTVVALHRAAYLLYTDRRRYERGGVLVVGPSGVFMRYIERVLPSLGETAVALRSLGEVVDGVRATRHDEPAVADVKGSERMAELVRRTARQQAPGTPEEFRIFWRDDTIVLDRGGLGRLRRQLMSQGRRNRQLPRVAHTLLDAMWRQVRGERGRDRGREAFNEEMLSDPRFLDFATAWWPPLDAPTVLGWLRDPDFLARVADGLLSDEEQVLLAKSWAGEPTLSVEDVPLLDELRYALGDVPARTEDERDLDDTLSAAEGGVDMQELMTAADREYAPTGRAWAPPTYRIEDDPFAHVLIDEAQDLTPMQWRMVGRRGRTASWTIVGDPAQSSWPVPAESARGPGRGARGQGAPRVPPLDELPQLLGDLRARRGVRRAGRPRRRPADRGPLDRRVPARSSPASPTWRRRSARPWSTSRARSPARSASWCRSPGGRRSTPGWRRGPSWPRTPPAPAPPSTPRPRRPARTGSWCSPASTPRAWSSTASWSSPRRRSRTSRPPAGPLSTSSSTRATQLLTTVS